MNSSTGLRGLRLVSAALVFCVAVAFQQIVGAATLDVDFSVGTNAGDRNAVGNEHKEIIVFLLDQSYSMASTANEVGRYNNSRDEVLREMLKIRLGTIAEKTPKAEIYVITFSGDMKGPFGPYSAREQGKIFSKLEISKGGTLLYDTLAQAVEFGEGFLHKDPNARVRMFVYSDGKNEVYRDCWTRQRQGDVKWYESRTEQVPVVYNGEDASERFKRDYLGRITAYASSGKMSLETGCWLGPGNPPVMVSNKRKDDYKLELKTDGVELKNPASEPVQTLRADLLLPIPSRCERDLARLNAGVELEVDGRKFQGKMSLKPGRSKARINLPDDLPAKAFRGKLSVVDLPDAWKDVSISSPDPVPVNFAARGALSFVSVEPRATQLYVKVGDSVRFAAKAVEGASVTWSIEGRTTERDGFIHKFDRAGAYTVTAIARKGGFTDATTTIKVVAIDASVGVSVQPTKPIVGNKVNFSAKTVSKAESYSWFVDNQVVEVKTSKLNGYVFDKSDKHKVKARVFFGHGITGEIEQFINVAVKPYVKIVGPYSGQEFDFGAPMQAVARVEGEFDTIDWQVTGSASDVKSSVVDRKACASKPVEFKSLKGGKYKLVAVVKGAAGELRSETIPFSVKREDVMVRIDKPISGASVEVGKDLELKATAKGQSIKEVKWTVTCKGKELFSAKKPVQGGVSSCVFKPNVSLGRGAVLMVKAVAVDDAEVSSTVDVETSFFAALDIVSAKVGNREANGLQACFGDQVALEAACKGGVDATKVEWVEEIFGKERVIGNGLKVNAPKVSPSNSALVTAKYFARTKLPDGSSISSDKVTVYFACDDIIAKIILPKGADGLSQKSFRPGDKIHLQLEAEGGRLTDVEWDFGDGAKAKGDNVEHVYSDEKAHKVSAKGKCAKCGKTFSTSVVVSTACPDLELAIVLPKGDDGVTRKKFGLKESVNVEVSVRNGEAKDVVWNFGDGKSDKGSVSSHVYGKYGTYSVAASATCKRCGKSFTTSREEIEITVIPPQAKFEIKEKGSYYTVGGKLHLESKSTGDVDVLVWTVDGSELAEYRGKSEAIVQARGNPCEMVIGLQAIGPSGTDPSYTEREVRIRYGWWATVPAVIILLLLLVMASRLFFHNGPKGWEFYTWEGPAPKQINGGYPDELGDAYLSKGVPLEGVRKWNYWTKKGRLRLGDMLMLDEAADNVWGPFSEDEFEVKSANGTPLIRPPDGKFDDVTGEVNITGEAPYFLFRYYGSDYMDEIANGHDHVRVRVVDNGGGFMGVILFLLSLGLLIWAFVVFCLHYAI